MIFNQSYAGENGGLIIQKCVLGLLGGKTNQNKAFTVKDFGEMQRNNGDSCEFLF